MSLKGYNSFFKDYMYLKNTLPVRGLFVCLTLFFYHNRFKNNKKIYINQAIIEFLGQKLSSMFFFYSGYGIYESIKTKQKYAKYLPKKALIIFIKIQIAIVLYLIRNAFFDIYDKDLTFKTLFLSIILKGSLGQSSYFAYTIILFYLYASLSFIFIKDKKHNFIGAISLIILSILHLFFTYYLYQYKLLYYVDNILPFIIGILYALIMKYTDKFFMLNDFIYYGFLSLFIILLYVFYIHAKNSVLINNFMNATFVINIVLITMKVRLDNGFLDFLNAHSYSMYLLQNLVLQIFRKKNLFIAHEFIRIFIEFLFIIVISTTFDFITSYFIDKYFKKKDNQSENSENVDIRDSKDKIIESEIKSIPNELNLNN
jgi:peptidoglycan/LPS O-acetylase OafA/YrhL